MHLADDGKPIFDYVTCWGCSGVGTVQRFEPCPNAGQTFRKGCPICGKTRKADHAYRPKANRETCQTCEGDGRYVETRFDSDKTEFWKTLPFRVFREKRRQTFNEAYLGFGSLCSVTDYGRYKSMSDEELIAKAKDIGSVQYTSYVTAENKVASAIGVFCHDQGYTVTAIFEE